jgi:predicted  nucleic acid-binding Zn-ribbon protein
MLFIEAEGNDAPRFAVEFHPRITVVSKLSNEMRERLSTSLHKVLAGEPADLVMSVDVGGVPQPLSAELLARLGLQRRPLDNVVTAADLPGAVVHKAASAFADDRVQLSVGVVSGAADSWSAFAAADDSAVAPHSHVEPTDGPLFEARRQLADAEAHLEEISQRLDAARRGEVADSSHERDVATRRLAAASARVTELQATVHELEATLPPKRESKVVRVIRLRQAEATINERIHQLRASLHAPAEDRSEVQRLLDAAISAGPADDTGYRRERLDLLTEQYHEDVNLLEKLEHQPRPPQWLIVQTQEQIDEAQARITAFTYQIKEGIDVRKQLQRAQEQLREAQEAWDELENGIEGEVRAARAKLEESVANIEFFLEIEPGSNIEASLESAREAMESAVDPRVDLVTALEQHHVDSTLETAVDVAREWLERQEQVEALHTAVQQELTAVLLDLGDVRKNIAEISAETETVDDPGIDRSALDAARVELAAALREQEDAAELVAATEMTFVPVDNSAEIAALEIEHQKALDIVEGAGRKVDYFAQLDALRHDDDDLPVLVSGDPEAFAATDQTGYEDSGLPWWEGRVEPVTPATQRNDGPDEVLETQVDLSQISEDDVEMYVLSRAAGLRMAARGESVPLIIDGAFDTLPPHLVGRLFAALAKISAMVQVVYLSSGNVAEDWVKRQSEMLAAKVTVERR